MLLDAIFCNGSGRFKKGMTGAAVLLLASFTLAGCSSGSGSGSGSGGINNPVPTITTLSPSSATVGTGSFTLTVSGTNFVSGAAVNWNGQSLPTTMAGVNQLTATVQASDIASTGTEKVTVSNPSPGGGASSALSFTVQPPLPPLTSRTDWKYLGSKVDAGADNSSAPQFLLYDPSHNQIFVSVPGMNVVEVFSTQTHLQTAAIPVPTPLGMDISLDSTMVYVGTGTAFLYVIDPVKLHVKQILNSADVYPGGFSSASPFVLNNGSLYVVPGFGIDGSGAPVLWSLSQSTAQVLNPPVDGAATRSGDHSSVVMASYGTGGDIAVYSAATNQFITTPYVAGDIVERVAANPVIDQLAVSDLDGNVYIYNSQLTLLGSIRIEPVGQSGGQRLNGMVFSADGLLLHLFVDDTIQEYDTTTFQLQAAMGQPYSLGTFAEPLPFAEDGTGLIYAINEEGVDFIDVSTIKSTGLTSLPYGYGYGLDYLKANTGPIAGGIANSSGIGAPGSEPTTVATAYFGSTPVWDLYASGNQYSFVSPALTTPGAENMLLTLSDSTPLLAPLAFSYGPDVVRLVTTASGADGSGNGFLVGYGFGNNTDSLKVTVGGQTATVTSFTANFPDLDIPFPTPIIGVNFTIPKGTAGLADVTLTTSSGTKTLSSVFQYTGATTLHASTAPLMAGVYDAVHKVIYFTSTNQILTWSVSADQWLSPITVPNSKTAQLIGISISPNGQLLAASDQGNQAVVVLNPDSPQSIVSWAVPNGGFGLSPVSVAATDQGTVYFDLSFAYSYGFGTRCQSDNMWMLDSTSGATTDLDPLGSTLQFCIYITDPVLVSPDGSTIYLNAGGLLTAYDVASGTWSNLDVSGETPADMALSTDGSRLVGDFSLFDTTTGYLGSLAWSDMALSDNQTMLLGEKMDETGAVMFQPWSNALDIVDLGHMVQIQRIALPLTAPNVFDSLVWDGDNDTAYMIVSGGVLEIPLTPLPIVLRSSSPSSGNAGSVVTLLGSGFGSGMTAKVDGAAVAITLVDEHTATLTMPSHTNGAAVITVTAQNGRSAFLDPGFMYGSGEAKRKPSTVQPTRRSGVHKKESQARLLYSVP